MKHIILLSSLTLLFIFPASAQFSIGVLGGIQSVDIANNPLIISSKEGINDYILSAQNSEYGVHFGIFTRLKIGSVFLQPEIVFNSNKVNYKWEDLKTPGSQKYLTETYQYLDIPIKLGIKKGPFVIHTGPVGHYFINSNSELWQIKDYDQKFANFKWSWELGAGIEFLFLKFDVHYERDLSPLGNEISIFGKQYYFDKTPAKLVASVYLSI